MTNGKEKLKELYETTVESGMHFEEPLDKIDYYSLFCKAASKDKLYKVLGNNVCMFTCEYQGSDAVLMVFFMPINTEDNGAKNVAERVMEVVEVAESCFITLDHLSSNEVKEDKFIYITIIKKVKE